MNNITVKNISKSYLSKDLFEDVSFSIHKGDRIALVGENGVGKSTLLKILSGIEEPDSGQIVLQKNSVAYIAQEFSGDRRLSVGEYFVQQKIGPQVWDIIKQFEILPVDGLEEVVINQLSGGQQRIIEIASVMSQNPVFLCIDEPENHLDIKSRIVLINLLKKYWGGVLVVSHDHHLVDEVTNKIIEIEDESVNVMSGKTYDEFMEIRRRNIGRKLDRWQAEKKAIEKLEQSVRMLAEKVRNGSDSLARTYQNKKRQLEERQAALGPKPDPERSRARISVADVRHKNGKLILKSENMSFAYPDGREIFQDVSVDMRFGETVFLIGRNGMGKTTFLNLLQDNLQPTNGEIKMGVNLSVEWISQTNNFDPKKSPHQHLHERRFAEHEIRSILNGLRFSRQESDGLLGDLSGGQIHRFRFSLMFLSNPDCIILDEPTNNLDPTTWQVLVDLVNEFTGSVFIITHDRDFIEAIENKRLWVLHNQNIVESWSTVDEIVDNL